MDGTGLPQTEREAPMARYKFLIVIEKANGNYSGYVPDLPGCVTTGKTPEEVKRNMQEAIALHLEGMLKDGIPLPQP
jgi:predicted RNase H-like HicB family nuclease